jgi:ornithine cyclodeaminase
MRYLGATDTRTALPMSDAVEAMRRAFSVESEAPLRTQVGGSLVMPGRLGETMAVKVVSTVPGNPAGLVAVFGGDGSPLGIVDGPTLTAIRTGAVSGLATDLLAPGSASTLAMLGAGAMAFDQVEAIRAVRLLTRVLVWSRTPERAEHLALRVGGDAVADADQAVAQAEIVSCATPSTFPLFDSRSLGSGTHVNAVGAYTPEMVELPADLVRSAYVVVDDVDAAAAEAGDLVQAGKLPDTTLRDLLKGVSPGIAQDFTVFKSVGIAAQDVAAAEMALANAERLDLGVSLS